MSERSPGTMRSTAVITTAMEAAVALQRPRWSERSMTLSLRARPMQRPAWKLGRSSGMKAAPATEPTRTPAGDARTPNRQERHPPGPPLPHTTANVTTTPVKAPVHVVATGNQTHSTSR